MPQVSVFSEFLIVVNDIAEDVKILLTFCFLYIKRSYWPYFCLTNVLTVLGRLVWKNCALSLASCSGVVVIVIASKIQQRHISSHTPETECLQIYQALQAGNSNTWHCRTMSHRGQKKLSLAVVNLAIGNRLRIPNGMSSDLLEAN